MKKVVFTFGIISGIIGIGLMLLSMPLHKNGVIDMDSGLILGYTAIVLSMLLVFFGIRSYRDNVNNGYITYGRGLGVGLLISLVSSLLYVFVWEIYFFFIDSSFAEAYFVIDAEKMKAAGATQESIDAMVKEMADMKESYMNPLINAAYTILEPLPVGVLVSLVSAGILQKRPAKA